MHTQDRLIYKCRPSCRGRTCCAPSTPSRREAVQTNPCDRSRHMGHTRLRSRSRRSSRNGVSHVSEDARTPGLVSSLRASRCRLQCRFWSAGHAPGSGLIVQFQFEYVGMQPECCSSRIHEMLCVCSCWNAARSSNMVSCFLPCARPIGRRGPDGPDAETRCSWAFCSLDRFVGTTVDVEG